MKANKNNFIRVDMHANSSGNLPINADEKAILSLAARAPSGHNAQPWFVKYMEPYHWIIGNDKSKWLPGVAPTQ
ncbi:MAG: nitroreductase, partial [Betaproteobacteria bacterium]